MTNYEKNKAQLDMYAVASVSWGVDNNGKIFDCNRSICTYCIFYGKGLCTHNRLKWLQQEHKEEPEVDWSKVPIDTPILVKAGINEEWTERIFAGYIFGKVGVFNSGSTSENFNSILFWDQAKLAKQEDESWKRK